MRLIIHIKKYIIFLALIAISLLPASARVKTIEGTFAGKANVTGFGGNIKYDFIAIVKHGHITIAFNPPVITEEKRPLIHDFKIGTEEANKFISFQKNKIYFRLPGYAKRSFGTLQPPREGTSDFSIFANNEMFSDTSGICSEGSGTIINISSDGNAILGFNTKFPIVTNPNEPLVQDQVLYGTINNDGTFNKVFGSKINNIETNITKISQDENFLYIDGTSGYPNTFSIKFSKSPCSN